MAHSSSTNMDPPKPKKPLKRKNQLRISQPIHHHENTNSTTNNTNININSFSSDSIHTPQRKKPRHSSSHILSPNSITKIPKKKSPNKRKSKHNANNHNRNTNNNSLPSASDFESYRPTHIYSCPLPLESESEMLQSFKQDTLINFSCISYDSLIDYCKMFKLHDFKYNYHYELAQKSHSNHHNNNQFDTFENEQLQTEIIIENDNNSMSARMSNKREMDDDGINENNNENNNKKRKKKKKKNKKREKENETEHHYFDSVLLDKHYEKKQRENIPKTLDESTRLTKSELVEVVKQHFLSTPLLKDLNEIDVVKQFLLFIQDRRKKLKREFCFE